MGIIRRGLAGAGEALEAVGFASLKSSLDEARQVRLQELASQSAERQQTRGFEHSDKRDERQEGYSVAREDRVEGRATEREIRQDTRADARQQAGFTHTEKLQTNMQKFQTDLAKVHEDAANTRHSQSTGIAMAQLKALQEGVELVPQGDGTFQRVNKLTKQPMGTATDLAGNPLTGPKDVSASTKIMVETNSKIIAALSKDLSDAVGEPQRQSLMGQINDLKQENQKLLGVATPAAQTSRTGWDSNTKQVFFQGQEIGKADSEAKARQLVANAKKQKPPAPSTSSAPPEPGADLSPRGILRGLMTPHPTTLDDEEDPQRLN